MELILKSVEDFHRNLHHATKAVINAIKMWLGGIFLCNNLHFYLHNSSLKKPLVKARVKNECCIPVSRLFQRNFFFRLLLYEIKCIKILLPLFLYILLSAEKFSSVQSSFVSNLTWRDETFLRNCHRRTAKCN